MRRVIIGLVLLVLAGGAVCGFARTIAQHKTCQAKVADQWVDYTAGSGVASIGFTYLGGCGRAVQCVGAGNAGTDQSHPSNTNVCQLRVPTYTTALAGVLAGNRYSYPLAVVCNRSAGGCTIIKRSAL